MENIMLKAALDYLQRGFSVIPIKGKKYAIGTTEDELIDDSKKPLIRWKEFQTRKPTEIEVREWWEKWPEANLAIVTGQVSGIYVIDIDTDEGKQAIEDYLPESFITPTAETAKGGQHLYCTSQKAIGNNTRAIPGCDFRGDGGYTIAPPSISYYGTPYAWIINLDTSTAPLPMKYITFITSINPSLCIKGDPRGDGGNAGIKMFEEGRRDNDLFHIAHCLTRGSAKREEAMQVLRILAKNCNPPYPESELEAKIQSALDRKVRGESGLTEELKHIIQYHNGIFCISDIIKAYQEYQNISSVSNSIKTQVRVCLMRLKEKGYINKSGNKDGYYVRVDDKCNDMDIMNVSLTNHPLQLPLDLRKYVKIMPKNIIVLAGAKSAGKTAMNLNIAWLNRDHAEGVYYYNSEMAKEEMRIRLDSFGEDYPLKEWIKIHFKERTTNFADVIKQQPDAIHIVDFLEIYDNFYEIGLMIRDIYDALNAGVAIVSIQKNAGVSLGLGGARSIEKARLYLSMDYGKITITDAKLFEIRGVNPRGWQLDYKLHDGCHYQPHPRGWYDPLERLP